MALRITRTAAAALRRGHPWVYREAILRGRQRAPETGETVELTDEEGDFLGRGLYDASSPIAVRVFDATRGPALSATDLGARVARAIARRDGRFDAETTAYRLCNGEGDRVPGMVIDRYGEVAVLRLDTDAWEPHLAGVARAIVKPLAQRGVRSIGVRVAGEGKKLTPMEGPPPPDRVLVREHGMAMEVDLSFGQKTGAFLDQRENRARVRALAQGKKRVLNLFSYAGGFSLAAALGGAARVTSVDVAAAAHATAQRSFRANGIDPGAHAFVSADVFAFLDKARASGERFDLIISDPPSFAPSERALPRAIQAYRKLHGAVASVLEEGGVLCASSCSSHVDAEAFAATLDDAALGRSDLRLCDLFGQPEDHPSLPAWPEGRYLKFAVLA
ncbi:MAG: class I SAM-dependent rRNA methyltransferase [Minicystis sp.]